MLDILMDSLMDTVKIIPILFIIFLVVDYLMNTVNKDNKLVDKFSKFDCVGGAILGLIPQCGIPVAMAKLYSGGLITLGMIMSVFLASSDEALIIIGAHPEKIFFMFKLMALKVFIGVVIGYAVNFFVKEDRGKLRRIYDMSCECDRCKPGSNIIVRNLVYTLKIFVFLAITIFLINLGMDKIGEDGLNNILGKNTFLQPVYASLIGMVPSCMSSVLVAEGFMKGVISFGALVAGLCSNTGFGILIIFKELPLKKAIKITLLIQVISILIGEFIFILF